MIFDIIGIISVIVKDLGLAITQKQGITQKLPTKK